MTAMRGTPSKLVMRTPAAPSFPVVLLAALGLNEGVNLARDGLIGARVCCSPQPHAATRWRG